MNVIKEVISNCNHIYAEDIARAKFIFEDVPIANAIKPFDKLEILCCVCRREDGTHFACIMPEAYNRRGNLLGPNGKPNDNGGITWDWLLRCKDLRKNSLFRRLFELYTFEDCQGNAHDDFDDNKKYLPYVEYCITGDVVNELVELLRG